MSFALNDVLRAWTVSALLCCMNAPSHAEDTPRHLAIARQLVQNITPENNQYVLGGRLISMPGDTSASTYLMRADCSGFLLAAFERAGYSTQSQMIFLKDSKKRKRPSAEDFVLSIERQRGFSQIRFIEDIRPGDLLAHALLNLEDQAQTGTTGHVFLIDGTPKPIAARKPVVNGTRQFEVHIIDSNNEQVGDDDSRLADPSRKFAGLGRGTIRLYADSSGELVGWAKTFARSGRFFSYSQRFPSDTKARKAVIGRPSNERAGS